MVSSLADQLKKSASINASLLSEKTRSTASSQSYLFSQKQARTHDLDSLHALALNAFLQLTSLQPALSVYEDTFLSEHAKDSDRSLLPAKQSAQLDASIAAFLPLLGPFLLDAPTGKLLEWLVRRFRIHEFNVQSVVALFLPYHDTPHFLKMTSILHIPDNSPLRFLQPYKATTKPLHRHLLVRDMLANPDLARFVASILPAVLDHQAPPLHRALIAFHTGVLLEYIATSKAIDENTIAILLPAALDPLQRASNPDSLLKPTLLQEIILGSYLVLAAISQKARLTIKAIKSILAAAVECAPRVSPKQLVRTLVSVCAPQDQLEKLPSSLVKRLITIPHIDSELVGAMAWVGAENFLVPLVDSLLLRLEDQVAYEITETILISPELLPAVGRSAASLLIRGLITTDPPSQLPLISRDLLSQLHQRHPKLVQSASQVVVAEDQTLQDAVERLILSLSVPVAGISTADAETATLLIGSSDADATIRAKAVRDLVARIDAPDVSEADLQSVSTTLLLRVHDTAIPVLQALYITSPEAVARAFSIPALAENAYIDSLRQTLHDSSSKPSRDVIRAHLSFLLSHFLPAIKASSVASEEDQEEEESEENRERSRRVFMDILLPFLLYSKPRMKTVQAVWEILETAEGGSVSFELLGGCVDAVKWEQARPTKKTSRKEAEGNDVELLRRVNLAVAAKIADNILASNYFQANFDALLERLHGENPHARTMAYLVVRALLSRLGGEQRVDAGLNVLESMKLDTLEGMGDFMRGVEDVGNFLDDASVGAAAALKPSSQNTLHRLQVSVLSVLPNFPRPAGVPLDWLAQDDNNIAGDVRGARYIQLLRAVDRLSNSSASLPLLSTHLLRTLFVNIGDDALAFLVGVWLTTMAQGEQDSSVHIQYAALRHACAFLEAHVATQRTIDFQTALPAMLVMLQSADAGVRDAALRCIAVVTKLTFSKEAEAVYAVDTIYGADTAKLRYLDWADFQKYMKAIGEGRDHLVHDPEYVQTFHREHLAPSKGESKKTAGYKQRVLCYLLSHVNSCALLHVKTALLRSVDTVSNAAKAQALMPTIEALLGEQSVDGQLAALVASAFDASAAADLNDVDKPVWGVYEKVLVTTLKEARWARARDALLHRLQHGLFAKLTVDRKSQLCRTLLQIGAEDVDSSIVCKKALANVLDDGALVIRLFVSLQPQPMPGAGAPPANKRPRVEKTATAAASQELSPLAVLAEVVASLKITGTLELISCLLESLSKVASHVPPDVADRRYVEQLLMSALENIVEHFPSSTVVAPGSIRVDTLVEILRTSENPQTFHQACLLMASLARVVPDAVLHNIMPIFTFMGSNVFHRDDTYSFRVVQKTIDNIVPVMVASLKEGHGSGVDLYDAAREFLRVFTNAATHVPRHRRVGFFSHLVDTLGPADFLAPITMLLVDRVANRVVRQSATESGGSLFLPLAVHERYAAELQLPSLVALVQEVQRLANNDDPSVHAFLEDTTDDEQAHAELASKRRATALLMFSDHALKRLVGHTLAHTEKLRAASQELLVHLLAVSVAKADDASYGEVATAARAAMASTLGVMSAPDFVKGILTMLRSDSVQAQAGALQLLAERLPQVAQHARRTLTPSIVKIAEAVRNILSSAQDHVLVRSALEALGAISTTIAPGEEGAITPATPIVLGWLSQQALRMVALRTLLAFSSTLGPRAIPYLKDIVKACVSHSREAIASGSEDQALVPTASNILRNLLTSIPTFWGRGSSHAPAADIAELSLLVKTVAKRASPNVLLPALCSLWTTSLSDSGKEETERILAYTHVVKISVKAASRPAVLENIRELFKTFLSMFDLCASGTSSELESAVTSAFIVIVVKLNETAFRPIFRKMFDWAFAEDSARRIVIFCHVYSSLLDFFKTLMVPYMTFAWQALLDQLRTNATAGREEGRPWLAVLRTLGKSLSADEDRVFWRNDKLRQLLPLAVKQVPVAIDVGLPEGKSAVSDLLASILGILDDDVMSKSLNLDVLMHSRSEDARVRLFSLSCAGQLWRSHGDKLLGFVAETATFIAEAAEDENDLVVREAHKMKMTVEAVGGSIDTT
ncbi:hypothetical protein C8Q80DRAFT_1221194 [Daedaleopsis nitida]|nr:hypothetical protein C8Q80DRAFT_1221194 [Daedaleopsis nitida]